MIKGDYKMARMFNHKGITYCVPEGCWFTGVREPEIIFEYDENFLNAVKSGNSLPIYEILTEWVGSKEYQDLQKIIQFESAMSSSNSLDYYFGCGSLNGLRRYTQEMYDELQDLLNNKFLDDDDREYINNWIASRSLTIPRKERVPIPGYVYLIRASGLYKIGKTKSLKDRTSYFATKMPVEVETIHTFSSQDHHMAEKKLHKKYAEFRKTGEWFDLSEEQVKEICSIKDDEI